MGKATIKEVDLGNGMAKVLMKPKDGIFYKVLSEICDLEVNSESDLLGINTLKHKCIRLLHYYQQQQKKKK